METRDKGTIRIGIVGLGRCGGNIAAELAGRGYRSIAVNVGESDLRALPESSGVERLCLSPGRAAGTGGSRQQGAEILGRARAMLEEALSRAFADVDLVVTFAGLGGGTGGNLASLVRALAGRAVIAIGVLPAARDPHHIKLNALRAADELVEAPFEALAFVDNQKLFSRFGTASLDRFLPSCNAAVADALVTMIRGGSDPALTAIRSFDAPNVRRVLKSGGTLAFGRAELSGPLEHPALLQAFLDIVNHNDVLAGEYELEDAVAVGTVIIADERVLGATSASLFDAFQEEVRLVSSGVLHEVGIYRAPSGLPPELHVVVGGLGLPSRLDALIKEVGSEVERSREKQAAVRRKLKRLNLTGLPESLRPPPPGEMPPSKRGPLVAAPPPLPQVLADNGGSVDDEDVQDVGDGAVELDESGEIHLRDA